MAKQISQLPVEVRRVELPAPLPDALDVAVSLMDSDVAISGGTSALMEGRFIFNPQQRPMPHIDLIDNRLLKINEEKPRERRRWVNADPSKWELKFSHALPIGFSIESASGDAALELSELAAAYLDYQSASGDLAIRINESQPHLRYVKIRTASGDSRCGLGGHFASLTDIKFESASGDLKAALNGDFPLLEQVSIHQSSGDMRLGVNGIYRKPMSLDIKSNSGDCAIDLAGQWHADLHATIHSSSGSLLVHVPDDVGVIASVRRMSGNIKLHGMHRKGDAFVNETYGRSAVILNLELGVSSGSLHVYCGEMAV